MKRCGHLLGVAALSACASIVACGGHALSGASEDGDGGADASAGVDAGILIGTPCLPSQESSATFDGFSNEEVSLNFSSTTRSGEPMCVVDHFRGLVTCPYGQSATGQPPAGASACTATGGQLVVGMVEPQCVDRPASEVVVWSCRCANFQNQTDDGYTYCTCPSNTVCTQIASPLGASEDDFSGAYCVLPAALFDGGATCAVACSPMTAACP
jgi:hypothetical protein